MRKSGELVEVVTRNQGRILMREAVERFQSFECIRARRNKLLSEQDITTKFVLPMFESLNWSRFKITNKGPEIHEKAFREKGKVQKGLPDIALKSRNGTVYVEVKRPPLGRKGTKNLDRYEDADLVALTSFEDLKVYVRHKKDPPTERAHFKFTEYVDKFDDLWKILSNTKIGKEARAGYKASRGRIKPKP